MRVAIVVERFDPGGGGVESAAFQCAAELARRGHTVTAVCREARDSGGAGVSLLRLPVRRGWQPLRIARFSRAAAAATRTGFDVVHAFARTRHQHVYRAGGGSHAAYLEHVHARPSLRRAFSPRHRAILRIEEAVFRDPAQWIQCNAQRHADDIARRYGTARERLVTIYNGVDIERFSPQARARDRAGARDELGLDGPTVLFAGSGFQRKGLDRAIDALARARVPGTLLVAGRGDPRRYARQARRLGLLDRVRFLGPRRDIERLYAAADLLLLPTRYDPFSNACLEAMAAGLAVATSTANGAAELIRHERNGLVYAEDFAPALGWLEKSERLVELSGEARASAERLSWARHADEVLALYARVLG